METSLEPALVATRGRFIDPYAVAWLRRLPVGIDEAWRLIASVEGLTKWWIVPPRSFELKPGGRFDHHWTHVIDRFETNQFVQFGRPTGDPREVLRFELRESGQSQTDFCFIDTWAENMTPPAGTGLGVEQPAGPGTPWVGVLVGWHQTVDRLQQAAGASLPVYSESDLMNWYSNYLNDQVRWREITARPDS